MNFSLEGLEGKLPHWNSQKNSTLVNKICGFYQKAHKFHPSIWSLNELITIPHFIWKKWGHVRRKETPKVLGYKCVPHNVLWKTYLKIAHCALSRDFWLDIYYIPTRSLTCSSDLLLQFWNGNLSGLALM